MHASNARRSGRGLVVASLFMLCVAGCSALGWATPAEQAQATAAAKTTADQLQQKLSDTKTQYQQQLANAQALAAQAQSDKDAADATDDQAARDAAVAKAQAAAAAQKQASDTLATLAKWQSTLDKLTSTLQQVTNADGSINPSGAAAAASAVIQPPWNLLALIGVPLLVGGIQQMRVSGLKTTLDQTTTDAKSIINSIDALKADPTVGATVRDAMNKAKDAMQKQLTNGARDLIASEKLLSA